jgi:hypothetical protein
MLGPAGVRRRLASDEPFLLFNQNHRGWYEATLQSGFKFAKGMKEWSSLGHATYAFLGALW